MCVCVMRVCVCVCVYLSVYLSVSVSVMQVRIDETDGRAKDTYLGVVTDNPGTLALPRTFFDPSTAAICVASSGKPQYFDEKVRRLDRKAQAYTSEGDILTKPSSTSHSGTQQRTL